MIHRIFCVIFCFVQISNSLIPQNMEPVQLLSLSGGNSSDIVYNQKAVQTLFLDPKLADRNAVIISIVGAFRKGKSFLMNYMLRYMYANYKSVANSNLINENDWLGDENEPLTGFAWKSGTTRITTGLILWSDVFLYDEPNGDKLAIYLMDTQGLFDHKSSPTDNSRIFSLSTMISSVQILNLFNIIQENQLQYLQFATEYARYARAENDQFPFQNLLILIRDFNNPEEYKYGIRGGNLYLNNFLAIHDYQSPELQSVRRYLRSSFEKLDCFLMPYPGKTVARDSRYDGRWADIDEDFLKSMHDLFEILLSPKKLKQKTINGSPVKPPELLVFINNYVESFKSDGMPDADSIYESTLEKQFRILVGKSVDIYFNAIGTHDTELNDEEDVNKLHLSSKDKALKFFNSEKKFGSYSEGSAYKKELQDKLELAFTQWKPVTMNNIHKLKAQRQKTNKQLDQVHTARIMDEKAKAELDVANKNAEEAKQALQQARNDTAEARREAEELRRAAQAAELERHEAIEKEKQTREWLEEMRKKSDFFEQQYNELRQNAIMSTGTVLGDSQSQSGFSNVLSGVTSFLTAAVPLIATIGGFFG